MEAEDEVSHSEQGQVQEHKDVDKSGPRGKVQGLPGDGNRVLPQERMFYSASARTATKPECVVTT